MNEDRYWKCEYENLRRKKEKQIQRMIMMQSRFAHKTYDLLKILGMTEEQIFKYYKGEKNG